MHDDDSGGGVLLRPAAPLRDRAGERGDRTSRCFGGAAGFGRHVAQPARRHDLTGADRALERTTSVLPDADGSSALALVGACTGIVCALLLATGWPIVWVLQLVEALR